MPHDAAAAEDILASRAFVKKACAVVSTPDNGKPRPAPKTARYNSTCRILTDEDRGYVGVSMTEDDAVDGYIHASDLALWGLSGNMPGSGSANRCFPLPAAAAPKPGTAGLGIPAQRVSVR